MEDALHATLARPWKRESSRAAVRGRAGARAAVLEGLARLKSIDEEIGVNIIKRACEEPVRQIVGNAGYEGAIVIEKIRANKDPNFGFNAATVTYEDLVKSGVIDPTKVTRSALQNAASISALMLTTEAMIAEIPEKKAAPMPGGEHGPGMDY